MKYSYNDITPENYEYIPESEMLWALVYLPQRLMPELISISGNDLKESLRMEGYIEDYDTRYLKVPSPTLEPDDCDYERMTLEEFMLHNLTGNDGMVQHIAARYFNTKPESHVRK